MDVTDKARRAPTSVDAAIAARLKARRLAIGMSQQRLAELIGVSFQQVQKYENGRNRISASRLQSVLEAMNMTAAEVTAGIPRAAAPSGFEEAAAPYAAEADVPSLQEAELLAAFRRVADPNVRDNFLRLLKSYAATPRRGRPPRG